MNWNYLLDNAEISFDLQLLEYIEQNENTKVGSILRKTPELCSAVDLFGTSLLHFAAEYGNENIAKFLINSGSKVNLRNKDGNTPLLLATKKQQVGAIKILLECNADIYICDNNGKSALQLALHSSPVNIEVAKLYLEQISNECSSDSSEIAKKLIKIKCPLYTAVLLKNIDVTSCMLTKRCSIDAKDPISGKTALHFSIENVDLAHVKKLLHLRADVNAKDESGKTPLALLTNFSEPKEASDILNTLVYKTKLTSCDNHGYMQIHGL